HRAVVPFAIAVGPPRAERRRDPADRLHVRVAPPSDFSGYSAHDRDLLLDATTQSPRGLRGEGLTGCAGENRLPVGGGAGTTTVCRQVKRKTPDPGGCMLSA